MMPNRLKQKIKEERDAQRNRLDSRHHYMILRVSESIGLDANEAEEQILEENQIDHLCNIIKANGTSTVLFFYQSSLLSKNRIDGNNVDGEEGKGLKINRNPNSITKEKLIITDGKDVGINGMCYYFLKSNTEVEVTVNNVHMELMFNMIDCSESSKLLHSLSSHISTIYRSILSSSEYGWGELIKDKKEFLKTKHKLLSKIDAFVESIESAQNSLDDRIILEKCTKFDWNSHRRPSEFGVLASQSHILSDAETCMRMWSKQIEQVLAESEQIRKEADNIGPRAELIYWKRRTARFNYLLDQLKQWNVRNVLGVLIVSKSKLIKQWKELDGRITEKANEAENNVRYLYELEKCNDVLYDSDPVTMLSYIPQLISSIRMINSCSTYYNTSERMTSLFVKITNQLINSCRNYITEDDIETAWTLEKSVLLSRIGDCVKLYDRYYDVYQKVKKQVANSSTDRPFDFSEMYIFGKYKTFIKRLENIKEMFNLIDNYSPIQTSTIEGIEMMGAKLNVIVTSMKKKKYNFFDVRRKEFQSDFNDFKRAMSDLHNSICSFIDNQFEKVHEVNHCLELIKRFELLKLPNVNLTDKYEKILVLYSKELEYVKRLYEKDKRDPPIARNHPISAGAIVWARQLYRRIEQPMNVFVEHNVIKNTTESRRIVRLYNSTCLVLLKFEENIVAKWKENVDIVLTGLRATLLIRNNETEEIVVNFDPQINELIRESICFQRIGIKIPSSASDLLKKKVQLREWCDRLNIILKEYMDLKKKIPSSFELILLNRMSDLEMAIQPGIFTINWLSFQIDSFIESIENELEKFRLLMNRTNELIKFRIEKVLKDIGEIQLVHLPEKSSMTIDQFQRNTERDCENGVRLLSAKSQMIENAAIELLKMIYINENMETENEEIYIDNDDEKNNGSSNNGSQKTLKKMDANEKKRIEELELLNQNAHDLIHHFNNRTVDAIVRLVRSTLESIRKRVMQSSSHLQYASANEKSPTFSQLFRCEANLYHSNIVMEPNIDDLQTGFNLAITEITNLGKHIMRWRKHLEIDLLKKRTSVLSSSATGVTNNSNENDRTETPSPNYHGNDGTCFKMISEHKDVTKLVSIMNTCIVSLKKEINQSLDQMNSYEYLWKDDKKEELEKFLETQPHVADYSAKLKEYDELKQSIENENDFITTGCIAIYLTRFKLSLYNEIGRWRTTYSNQLEEVESANMNEIFNFIEDLEKKLQRQLNDLDDIRLTMSALSDLRENEVRFEMNIGPIEETYNMLQKDSSIAPPKDELEKCDVLRYSWEKVCSLAQEVSNELTAIQAPFQEQLVGNVKQFKIDCFEFYEEYRDRGPNVVGIAPREASDRLSIYQNIFDQLYRRYVTNNGGEILFGLPVTPYPELLQIKKELNLLHKLYSLYDKVLDTVKEYYELLWIDVDIGKINGELLEFQNKCRRLPKGLKDWPAYTDLKKCIDDFSESCPLLELMTDKAMKKRHWQRISDLTKHQFDLDSDDFKLKNIMEAPLLINKDDIEDICISAVKEKDIEAKMKMITSDWNNQEFQFITFKNRGELLLKGDRVQEIIAMLEDSLMMLSGLLSNRYNTPFRKNIQLWVKNLTDTNEIIESWMQVQNLWLYLEAVFVGGDIAKQLPKEAKRFSNIDKSWMKLMTRAHETTNVVQCCVGDDTLHQLLPHLLEQLELCQKSLTGYLEKKRLLFPRFFFVSDPALLEILGQASDPHTIQSHLLSVFDNTKSVSFHEKDYEKILSIHSAEGETIELEKFVRAEGNVEVWLQMLLQMSQRSVHAVIRTAYMAISDTSNFNLLEFLATYPAQVGLLGIQLIWTRDATEALSNTRFDKKIMSQTNQSFLELLNLLISQTTKDLTKMERTKFETLVTIHVHQRDIFDDICKMHVKSPLDFEWLKQTRFYFQEDVDKLIIQICDVDFQYQNEFLGCTERLVITPLTDRCYITLAQALHMSMGGAPAGPAGTGKTETVKDMGRCLGKYVVVFNCSDQMDFRGLGRIYKGLAQSGSWGCFDEFNRIDLPVLSVAAQQIAIVLSAKKERKKQFIFTDGDNVELNPEFGLFLTMNPGYAGRQELPENLKINFRTVAMMVPDRQIIIRVKLASVGFINNIVLARKFFVLYKLCEEQLSKQVHYDFGLRNILSVLRTLGSVKRSSPSDTEETIVMRVLRDMNLSKLIDEDEPLFSSLINDLFPGIQLDKAGYPELESAIEEEVRNENLVCHQPWLLKLIQLYETQRVRHGMMTLGPAGAGKTCCIHLLMKAMSRIGHPHKEMRMNPKAITAPQMFGRLDVATNDWTDGIFSTLWRRTLKTKKGESVWLVLDGPVDAIWIENLNSVLDDNKTLTLANGDRIPMAANCKIIFEVHNIDNASPATVSRNGMVFMSSSIMDWEPMVIGWLQQERNQMEYDVLLQCFSTSFNSVYRFGTESLVMKMDVLECMIVQQACNLLSSLLPSSDDKDHAFEKDHLKRLYVFVLMWSIGGLLELDDRSKLETFMASTELNLPLPNTSNDDTMFEYFVDSSDGQWHHWNTKVQEYHYPTDHIPEFSSILVPNVDNVRTTFLVSSLAKRGKAVLLTGEQGTAKTVILKNYMTQLNADIFVNKSVNFSSATTPNMYQRMIESFVEKRVGTTYGPPTGKKMIVFIDDVNMPFINEWGDQITNEIVRQLMENDGFYSLEKPGEFTSIVDVQYLAAMMQPGGGRNDIPQRLKRKFGIINCTLPSNISMDKIFGVIARGHYCKERGFNDEVQNMVNELVPVTRRLWQLTKTKMLPTPAKFHYVFNLRDLSRIWQGIINTISSVISSKEILISLWKHEMTRTIADRFVNNDDCMWFERTLRRCVEEELKDPTYVSLVENDRYFVDFLRDAPEATGEETEEDDSLFDAPKIYEPIDSFQQLEQRLLMFMQQNNEAVRGSGLDLVFFSDAVKHLIKISRIIRTPQGSALLVGVGGSGKQSLTKLASFIAGYQSFQITLTKSYNATNLAEDLKNLFRIAGLQGQGVSFIFTDNDIKDENFLEYINNLLASGFVAGLFARDEIDEITQELIPIMKKQFPRRPPTNENLMDYFLSRARHNLHMVLCFSPIGEKFRSRALKFSALISGCTMDWFQRWPKQALVAVADHFLKDFRMICTPETKKQVIECMGTMQDDVAEKCTDYFQKYRRTAHVTPKSYLSFIIGYKNIYTGKKEEIEERMNKMIVGLEKLVEASVSVEQLSKELVVKENELEIAKQKSDAVLQEVNKKKEAAEVIKSEVLVVKNRAQGIVDEIAKDEELAMTKLEAAIPDLEEAEAALNTIKGSDIATLRRLGKPPHLIMRILDCVLILFKSPLEKPINLDPERPCIKPSWDESLKIMAQTGFLQVLLDFQKDTINGETVELMQPYLEMEDYNFEQAKKVCGNVAGLLSWTIAMTKFFTVNRGVLPLKANLIVQKAKAAVANGDLMKAQQNLDEKQAELDKAQAELDEAMNGKQRLMDEAATCQRKMEAAETLIDGLGDEKIRWTQMSKEYREQIGRLAGDVLLCTGFLSYFGPFNQEYRHILRQSWNKDLKQRKIPLSPDLNVVGMLVESTTIGEWNIQGLPNDDLSTQNGIIVTKAARFPLLIDPQGQGKNWIKNRESQNDLQITSLNHKYFRQHLEDALSLGRPLLIEDVGEELDPTLDNVLDRNFIKSGSSFKVKLSDKEVDVLTGFSLYITTKMANPNYTPEVSARCSIINFTVTMKGLEDQLLGRVILTERKELENERVRLVQDVTKNQKKTKELEENLLFRLTSVQGSLVDDEDLIVVLKVTKTTSKDVKEKLKIAEDTEIKIVEAREEYRPVAARGSILYFLIVEMSLVNTMYQTSLKQFLNIFDTCLEKSQKSPLTSKRIQNIIEYMTYEVFKYAYRGYYEEHKFMFTLLLTLKVDLHSHNIRHEEFETLIKGGASLDLNTVKPKPAKWILDMTWLNLVELNKLHQFSGIIDQIERNDKQWKQWFDKEAPEDEIIPDGYHSSLDKFRRLLLIRSWCPDRTMSQAKRYVESSIGSKFVEGVILDLEKMWEESNNRTPMICFLSMGSDPTTNIESLAKKKGFDCRSISMGQGQEIHARRLLQNAMSGEGGWVLFQNCHLSLDFCEELIDQLTETENISDECRVWITTEPHPRFPITLLQTSIKYTAESPQGIKASLRRSYIGITQDFLEISNLHQWRPMLYALSYLHMSVQERRKFGPLGWNIPYEFNQADFNASVQFIQNHLDDLDPKKGVSWTTVRYMIGEVQYGGRVTDDYDKRLLNTLCKVWFGEHMFANTFTFYKEYTIPQCKRVDDYLTAIAKLPTNDTPQAFGLHSNADITYSSNTAKKILDTILSVQPKDSTGTKGETRESVVYHRSTDMLNKLPDDYLKHEVKARLQILGALQPMNIFLRQEIDRMQRVISLVRRTLTDLKLAIDGTIVMNEDLRNSLDALYDGKIPVNWTKCSWESTTLGFWFSELINRNEQFNRWCFKGRPHCFWMTGFFNPQGFLTAMRQEVTRNNKGWALDQVVLANDMTKTMKDDIDQSPQQGVYVYGLFLEGAGWDKKGSKLIEPRAKVLFEQIPVIHLYAINVTLGTVDNQRMYSCPIYKKPQRTDLTYIAAVNLKTNQPQDHWIKRGVALLCDIK
ncbi:hypothetical protein SNEBB_000651 [Seison nebaliae]|nr:hypothetical protein SNEBB_000651 [Seison nebaliae]